VLLVSFGCISTVAQDAGRDVQWLRGDLAALPLPDDSADVVLSVFGVMYATDQAAATGELARIAAPGARVVFASWVPGSVLPAMGQVLSGYLPPPPASSGPPSRWGDPVALTTLLEGSGLRLTATSVQRLALEFPDAPAAADFLIRTAGHVLNEQQRLTDDGQWDDLATTSSASSSNALTRPPTRSACRWSTCCRRQANSHQQAQELRRRPILGAAPPRGSRQIGLPQRTLSAA
jgi:SAM-dependent methyltransferase